MQKFKDLAHFFQVLNDNIKNVVLRNYETLPNEFDPTIHGDIDLLVEDLQKVVSLTNAKPVFKEPYRVAYMVSFESGDIQFDFRYVGDNYLDRRWESEILADNQLITPPLQCAAYRQPCVCKRRGFNDGLLCDESDEPVFFTCTPRIRTKAKTRTRLSA